jgi:hypothetical protein
MELKSRRLAALREDLTPWAVAPFVALLLVVIASLRVPGKPCESPLGGFDPESDVRHQLVILTAAIGILLGVAATNRWAAPRRAAGEQVPPLPELWALLALCGLALAVDLVPGLAGTWAILSALGVIPAVMGFFHVLEEERYGTDLRNAGPWLPVYLGASGLFLYPLIAMFTLHSTANPICFG